MSDVTIAARNSATGNPVDGVLVRVFSGSTLVTSGTTGEGSNADGERIFNLSAGSYTMRLSMSGNGWSAVSPQAFTVTGVVADDVFDVDVEIATRPVAADSNLCRCSGYVTGPDGLSALNYTVTFQLMDEPVLLGNNLVSAKKVVVTTNSSGYAVVDLIRNAVYRVESDGYIGGSVYTRIPSLSSSNLPDIVFQVVSSVTFDPDPASVDVGETVEVEATIRYRSGLALDLSEFDGELPVTFSADEGNVTVTVNEDGHLVITGVAAGVDEIVVERVVSSTSPIVVYPAVELESTLAVTISA